MTLVSVVIPNHDYARYVCAAVDGVLAQTHTEVEVVVVDNGSTDDSLEVLARYDGDDRVRVVAQEDRGQAGARNRGVEESSGELVAFCDADDVWRPEKLAAQVAVLDGRDAVGLVYCGLSVVDEALQPIGELRPEHRGRLAGVFLDVPGANPVVGGESTALVRRRLLDEVGPFDPTLSVSSGFDMWRRVALRAEVDYVDEPLVLYRQHGASRHRDLDRYWDDVRRATAKHLDEIDADDATRRSVRARLATAEAKSRAGQREWRAAATAAAGARVQPVAALRAVRPTTTERMPLPHRVARRLGAAGWRGARGYWGAAAALAPLPGRVLVTLPGGAPLVHDPEDWTARNAYQGLYERAELALLPALVGAGDTVVDVGANIGYLTATCARLVGPTGRVVALEPSPRCAGSLTAVARALGNVEVHRVAAGPSAGDGELRGHDRADHAGLGSLRSGGDTGGTATTVPVRRLDDVLADAGVDQVALLKVDVEGYEPAVFEGATALLDGSRVRAYLLEVSPEFGTAAWFADLTASLVDRYVPFVVAETGRLRRRPVLVPTTPGGVGAEPRQFNLLLVRRDATDRVQRYLAASPR